MGNARILLEAGGYYHIYNHAVGKDNIFCDDANYKFFLRKVSSGIIPFADIVSYCLMPNHFHFLVRIKSHEALSQLWQNKLVKKRAKRIIDKLPIAMDYELLDEIIIVEFANLFNSYVQAFNKKHSRQGALLKESFQRKRIDTSDYLMRVICYIHNNPVDHGFTIKQENWKYSSFNATLKEGNTLVLREEVLEIFGGRENFYYKHQKNLGAEI